MILLRRGLRIVGHLETDASVRPKVISKLRLEKGDDKMRRFHDRF